MTLPPDDDRWTMQIPPGFRLIYNRLSRPFERQYDGIPYRFQANETLRRHIGRLVASIRWVSFRRWEELCCAGDENQHNDHTDCQLSGPVFQDGYPDRCYLTSDPPLWRCSDAEKAVVRRG